MRWENFPVWILSLFVVIVAQKARGSPAPRVGRPVKPQSLSKLSQGEKPTPKKRGRKTLQEKLEERSTPKRGRVADWQETDDDEERPKVIKSVSLDMGVAFHLTRMY